MRMRMRMRSRMRISRRMRSTIRMGMRGVGMNRWKRIMGVVVVGPGIEVLGGVKVLVSRRMMIHMMTMCRSNPTILGNKV